MARNKTRRMSRRKPQSESLTVDAVDSTDGVQVGQCTAKVCGDEAGCTDINSHQFKCTCPHDLLPPTPDLRCPNRHTVPLTVNYTRPIHIIIPPPKANNLTRFNVTAPHLWPYINVNNTHSAESSVVLAAIVASCLLLVVLSAVCCWQRRRLSNCCLPLNHKHHKKQPDDQDVPLRLPESLLSKDCYSPNPQYSPCSVTELSFAHNIPLLPRDHIKFLQEIGEGCFGKVYKGEFKADNEVTTVAIKMLKESATREAEEDFMREVEIMSAFKHSNILTLIGVALKECNKSPWMVFEFMPYGDLTGVLRSNSKTFWSPSSTMPRLSKDSLLSIAAQIAEGMAYLATQRFVHRDLACRNCLVGEGLSVKIADFGMSRDVYTCDYYKIGGSRLLPVRWMSPESVLYGRFTLESDVWSYGIVLWEIYSLGKQPHFGNSNEEVVKLILQGVMLSPPEDCPTFISDLMMSCWKMEPSERTNFPEIQVTLRQAHKSPLDSANLPRPPAFPVTPQIAVEVMDSENYLKPLPSEPKEYLKTLPD